MLVSATKQFNSIEHYSVKWRAIKRRRNWLLLTSLLQICTLLVASANSETVKLSRRANKDSIQYGVKSKDHPKPRQSRFIDIETNAGNVDIDLELKIPFLSIPLENKGNKLPIPQVKLNYKSLAFFGTLMAIITFVMPLIFSELPNLSPTNFFGPSRPNFGKEHKRTDRGLDLSSYLGDSLNEILENDNTTLAPCIKRFVCSAVATAKHAKEPTGFHVIVDTLSSHSSFDEAVNGTLIKEAAERGRQVLSADDCATNTTECAVNQQIVFNVLKLIGL